MKTLGLLLGLVFFMAAGLQGGDELLAIKAGCVHTVAGADIKDAVVIIRDGRVEKVLPQRELPTGATVVDFSGKHVYPGLVNPFTTLGLSGIAMVREWNDVREAGEFTPRMSAYTAFYPWSNLIPIAREFGTTVALSAPMGGKISGKAVLVELNGWSPEDMFLRREAALVVNLPRAPRRRQVARTGEKAKPDLTAKGRKDVREYFEAARRRWRRLRDGQTLSPNPDLDAVAACWTEKLPVIMAVFSVKDIRFAIKLAKELELNLILRDAYSAEDVLDEIRDSGHAVILSSMYAANREWEDGCDKVFRLPARLAKAGIPFAFSHASAATAFDLPVQASRALAYGLSRQKALQALTLAPARMLGLKHHGAVAPGFVADLVVTDGDIFDSGTRVEAVFIRGRSIGFTSDFQREARAARTRNNRP